MKYKLTNEQEFFHQRALELCRQRQKLEWQIIEIFQKIDELKLYCILGVPSLFQYAVQTLGLSESVAYSFISVARKAAQIPALKDAVKNQILSVPKASRIVSVLSSENAHDLIAFAKSHSTREVEFEVAKRNPKLAAREIVKPISEDSVLLKLTVAKETFELLKRAQDLVAQKKARNLDLSQTLAEVLTDYVQRQDPVHKAKRALNRTAEQKSPASLAAHQLCARRVPKESMATTNRIPLTAQQKHEVFGRDGGRCTHIGINGQRCMSERWLQIHHIRPVHQGGGNQPENLTTLCSTHHDLVHQLSLPLENQFSFLRSPRLEYRA